MNSYIRTTTSVAIVFAMMLVASSNHSSVMADLYVEGHTTGSFSNPDNGTISVDGQTFSWSGQGAAQSSLQNSLRINQPGGQYNFSGTTTFESTIGTLDWSNVTEENALAIHSADTSFDFAVTDPVNTYAGSISGRIYVAEFPEIVDGAATYELGQLIGSSTDIQHANGTLTVTLLAPIVSSGDGYLVQTYWWNPEGGESTLSLRARFTNVSNAVVPVPSALTLFATGAFGLVGFRRRRNTAA